MELPQARPYGTQGRKPTHSFLSLYSPAHQDSSSTPPGGFLETHDFLQPLERIGKNVVKEGNKFEEQPAPVEHILPGGIGTYSISHISSISQSQSQRIAKGEGVVITGAQSSGSDKNDENSNCSSYTGSGFSLWEESAVKKGGKEDIAGSRRVIRERGTKTEGVPSMKSMERPSQSSSAHNHPSTTVSSLSSSRPSSAPMNPNFVELLNSAKSSKEDEENQEQEFVIKKEPPSHYKVDETHHDQKPNTPRSKHSATEQRRRSKINDRFFKLRELIPHSDQKRDKASFLLEVIEYIQFLQEKVHKYEDSCRHKNNNNNQRPTKGLMDQPLVQTGEQIGQYPRLTNKGSSFPSPLQSKIYSPGCISTSTTAPLPSTLPTELANTTSQSRQTGSYTNDCNVTANDNLKDQEVTIESGTISISTVYSQGLLSTLTQALQNSGVDLSQASISVQIDLGKRANPSTPLLKKNEISGVNDTSAHSRLASTLEEEKSDSTLKRLKTNRN